MRRLLELSLVLAALGCEARSEPTPREAPEPTPTPTPEPAAPPQIATPNWDAEFGRRFASAAAGLTISETTPAPSLRWRAPECALEYAFRISVGNDPSGKLDDAMLIAGTWTARGEAPGMILQNGEIAFAQMLGGTRRPAEGTPAAALAEVRLQTDGHAWTEVDGPTSLWSAYGTWSGLTKFHPALPSVGASTRETEWVFDVHERSASGRVEGERGSLEVPEGMVLPSPAPTRARARVTLERWIEIAGARAAVLRSWSEQRDGGVARSQAQFVVLESGSLLHAELRERSEIHIGSGEHATVLHVTLDGEARLVQGCGEPVLPRFDDD